MNSARQQAAVVGAQVLGNLAGDVLGFAGRAVGLDTLRVGAETNPRDPADLASETDPTSRVTFGKSLGSKVDVTLSQSLVESNEQTWILDYLPVRRNRVALRSGRRGSAVVRVPSRRRRSATRRTRYGRATCRAR